MHVTRSDGLTGADPAALAAQRRLAESLGGTYHQVVGDNVPEALLTFARAENATQLVLGASRRSWLSALLTGPGFGMRTIRDSGDIDVHIVTHAQMGRGRGLPRARGGLTAAPQAGRLRAGRGALPAAHAGAGRLRGELNLTSDVLAFLVAVIAVALVGGFVPPVLAAIAGSLLLNYYFTPPIHKFTIAEANNVLALVVFVAVALRGQLGGGHRGPADQAGGAGQRRVRAAGHHGRQRAARPAGPGGGAGPGPRGVRHGVGHAAGVRRPAAGTAARGPAAGWARGGPAPASRRWPARATPTSRCR